MQDSVIVISISRIIWTSVLFLQGQLYRKKIRNTVSVSNIRVMSKEISEFVPEKSGKSLNNEWQPCFDEIYHHFRRKKKSDSSPKLAFWKTIANALSLTYVVHKIDGHSKMATDRSGLFKVHPHFWKLYVGEVGWWVFAGVARTAESKPAKLRQDIAIGGQDEGRRGMHLSLCCRYHWNWRWWTRCS